MSTLRTLVVAVLVCLGAVQLTAVAAQAKPKLRAIYWTTGTHHDYDAMEKVFVPVLSKHMDVRVCRDASFLDDMEKKPFDVIVMNHCFQTTEGMLDAARQKKLLDVIRGGIGVVAVHASYYSFPKWDAVREVYGAKFTTHASAKAKVTVRTVDPKHPIMKPQPSSFVIVTELYQSTPLAEGCHVLALAKEEGKDGEHPSVWTNMYGKGRVVTILPGHWPESFKQKEFQDLIIRSALWAADRLDDDKGE
ncbi:MAG: ThuA domain-containing protein [Phycisphaerae bacterium]|nr:ThuA domain-containing protein [Phycisphaerae bacterium]